MSSDSTKRALLLEPGFQHYAWGDTRFIPELYGLEVTGEPYAEAWFGAHPQLPSLASTGQGQAPLDKLLEEHGAQLLGETTLRRFRGLPFLLKVLSARWPLSIQVHPNEAQAREGFEREERAGIPRGAPERSYRDPRHKPELLVALTSFSALYGFRPAPQITERLQSLPELSALLPPFDRTENSLEKLVAAYFTLDEARRSQALLAWLQRLERSKEANAANGENPDAWVRSVHRTTAREGHPDPGLFFFALLNLVTLRPFQALFLPAGVPHAYLCGAGLEVMASSDNVLRGGLTPKPVNVPELLKVLRYEFSSSPVLEPVFDESRNARYPTPAAEFELSYRELRSGESYERHTQGPELWLLLSEHSRAEASITTQQGDAPPSSVALRRARACLLPDSVGVQALVNEDCRLITVRVPA